MLYNLIDANNKLFLGEVDSKDITGLLKIKYPLLMQYELHKSLGGSTAKFQHFDMITKPKEIRALIVTMYPATKEQTRLYQEQRVKLFPEVNDGQV